MVDVARDDATAQVAALQARTISARELLELELARNEAVGARINAVVIKDRGTAMAAALSIDEARVSGRPVGLLAGLPMTVKDTLDVTGMPATAGGVAGLDQRQAQDAEAIAHLRAAGAVIWGKTNMSVMGGDWQSYNRPYGTTNNPWEPERTAGGSSGGSAAALAAGVTALELGSDIAGSLRVPASFCGVFAHKPTFGLVSRAGVVPPRPGVLAERELTVVGPMARSARDLALLLSIITGGRTRADLVPSDLKSLRIGLWFDEPAYILDPHVSAVLEAFAAELTQAGAQARLAPAPVDPDLLLETYNTLLMAQIGAGFPEKTRRAMERLRGPARFARGRGAGPLSPAARILAATATHREWLIAKEAQAQIKAQMAAVFQDYDVLITPVAPVEPFFHDHKPFARRKLTCSNGRKIPYNAMMQWVSLATLCGLPATAIPAGFSSLGLPVGVQVIGPAGGDEQTLAAAMAIEAAVGGFVAPDL